MADARKDANRVPSLITKSDADNTTIVNESDPSTKRLKVNATITGTVTINAAAGIDYDYLDVQQTDSDTETFVFKTGGSGGTTVRTIVVNYTSSTKADIDNVTWS